MRRTHLAPLIGAAVVALGLTLTLILLGTSGSSTRGPSPSPTSQTGTSSQTGFAGAALPSGIRAPAFRLTDEHGRQIALGDYRGRVVILTFLATKASGTSSLVAQQIRGALDDLTRPAAALAISADPAADTPARVGRLLASASLTGRMEYLTGATARLSPVWHAYRVTPMSAGRAAFERAAAVLLIDPRGRERVLSGVEQLTPEGLAHDVRQLQAGR